MYETGKKAGLILGHAVCIFIIIYCIANSQELFKEEEKEVQTVVKPMGFMVPVEDSPQDKAPSAAPTAVITPEAVSITEAPAPTEIVTITETPVPTETVTITEAPTPTEAIVVTEAPTAAPTAEPELSVADLRELTKKQVLDNISQGVYRELDNKSDSWWFLRKDNHKPSGSGELFDIAEYQGFFLNQTPEEEDKVIYLTLDCGYGSSNTPVILDVLKKHEVKVTFFVTKFFLDANPEDVRRMVAEGHIVANHSVSHPNFTTLTEEEIYAEIIGCEEAFYNITGTQMDLFLRPPTGAYSRRTMQLTEDLGYKTVFWSIAYKDYDQYNQPGKEYVIDHFKEYHHNGAIVLMHNDSVSNMEAMDEVLTLLKEEGYRFGSLYELK